MATISLATTCPFLGAKDKHRPCPSSDSEPEDRTFACVEGRRRRHFRWCCCVMLCALRFCLFYCLLCFTMFCWFDSSRNGIKRMSTVRVKDRIGRSLLDLDNLSIRCSSGGSPYDSMLHELLWLWFVMVTQEKIGWTSLGRCFFSEGKPHRFKWTITLTHNRGFLDCHSNVLSPDGPLDCFIPNWAVNFAGKQRNLGLDQGPEIFINVSKRTAGGCPNCVFPLKMLMFKDALGIAMDIPNGYGTHIWSPVKSESSVDAASSKYDNDVHFEDPHTEYPDVHWLQDKDGQGNITKFFVMRSGVIYGCCF